MTGIGPTGPRVAILSYSTKPRGGVVHTLHLAENLHDLGHRVHVFALGDPAAGFFRPLRAPHTILPAPGRDGTLEERVASSTETLVAGLSGRLRGRFDLVHAQDCIAARAGVAVTGPEDGLPVIRTVHHVDDFVSQALVECQRRSILDPDHVVVVSRDWQRRLREEFGVDAEVVTNGVDSPRFARPSSVDGSDLRARVGARGSFLFLTVGGIEPRKGSLELVEALAKVRAVVTPPPVVAVVGGHSFQDYDPYRERVLDRAGELGLSFGEAVALLGTVPEDELTRWYHTADAFVFPSHKEGWGLALLEALAAGLATVATDIPVFREFLGERDALLVPAGAAGALADAMVRVASDPQLRSRLGRRGPRVAGRFTWRRCAEQHAAIYRRLAS
ncbi:MAG TPA: MSMEG_0565 family glycosyltransferase [Actinomycetes bacterium]|jgi:glycosyltransferase-like protein|nr:MSMEG_0565 family glycosyltransferase [Actinomycetes bacterium]